MTNHHDSALYRMHSETNYRSLFKNNENTESARTSLNNNERTTFSFFNKFSIASKAPRSDDDENKKTNYISDIDDFLQKQEYFDNQLKSIRDNENTEYFNHSLQKKVINPKFSICNFYFFMIIHSASGLYCGANFAFGANFGKPVIKSLFGLIGDDEVDYWLDVITWYFGIGQLVGYILAGSIAKLFGKHYCLYFSEIFNIISLLLIFFSNKNLLVCSRMLAGITFGFNSILTPR